MSETCPVSIHTSGANIAAAPTLQSQQLKLYKARHRFSINLNNSLIIIWLTIRPAQDLLQPEAVRDLLWPMAQTK